MTYKNLQMSCELRLGKYQSVLSSVRDINIIITSPPYNIGSKSPAKTIPGNRKRGDYDPKSFRAVADYPDDLPENEYQKNQHDFLVWCNEHIKPNGVIIYNHKPRHKKRRVIWPTSWFPECLTVRDYFTWNRGSTHNHSPSFLFHQTEMFYVLSKPDAKIYFKNQDRPGGKNKGMSDVWCYPRAQTNGHNAPFPMELIEQVLRLWSREGDLVCDPYSGSGTVMRASAALDRRFIGSEVLEKYYNLSVDLFENVFRECLSREVA